MKTKIHPIPGGAGLRCFLAVIALALSLTFLSFRPVCAQDPKESEALFIAKKTFDDGFYDIALVMLERFLESYPDSEKKAEAELLVGQCYYYQNRFLDALKKFEGLLGAPEADKMQDAVLFWIAEVHFRGNNFAKSSQYYKNIINRYPRSEFLGSAYYSLGWCSFQEHRFKEALEYFDRVAQEFPSEGYVQDAEFKIIECLYNLRNFTKLKEKILSYKERYPDDLAKLAYLYFYLAEAAYYEDDFEEAILNYSRIILADADPKIQELSKLGMGWSYLKLKGLDKAREVFGEVRREYLGDYEKDILSLGKARMFFEESRFNESAAIYEELLSKEGAPAFISAQAYIGKAEALLSRSLYDECIAVYRQALEDPYILGVSADMEEKLRYGLASAYLRSSRLEDAVGEFRKIYSSANGQNAKISALMNIAEAYADYGDYPDSRDTYDSIIKEYPLNNPYEGQAYYRLAMVYIKMGDFDKALEILNGFYGKFPDSELKDDVFYASGLAYFNKNDYNKAKEVFESIIRGSANKDVKAQSAYSLGLSLCRQGKAEEAIGIFRDAIGTYNFDTQFVQKCEFQIAECYFVMGQDEEALGKFNALRSKYPDSYITPEVLWRLGEYHYTHNDLTMASRYFLSLVSDFPDSSLFANASYVLGVISLNDSSYSESQKYFNKAIERASRSGSDVLFQAADALCDTFRKQGMDAKAVSTYEELSRKYPRFSFFFLRRIGDLFYETQDYARALEYYLKVKDSPALIRDEGFLFRIAETIQSRGESGEAAQQYLKLAQRFPGSDTAVKSLLRAAKIYEDKEDFQSAVEAYQKVKLLGLQESAYAAERLESIMSKDQEEVTHE